MCNENANGANEMSTTCYRVYGVKRWSTYEVVGNINDDNEQQCDTKLDWTSQYPVPAHNKKICPVYVTTEPHLK